MPKELSLRECKWELKGFWPWVPLKGTSMEIGNELLGVTEWMPATVPGGVHQDLFKAGLIENPYEDLNSIRCEWVENRWWVYRTEFAMPALKASASAHAVDLVCKGIDYEALIYWNGRLLGEHRGMYEPAQYPVTGLSAEGESVELLIVLKHAPDEMGQIGKTSETFTQKSRFNYKWDFSTRLVNIGLWDDVVLEVKQTYSIKEVAVHTDVDAVSGSGLVDMRFAVDSTAGNGDAAVGEQPKLHVTVVSPEGKEVGSCVADVVAASGLENVTFQLAIDNPQLWYPNGYGEQPLYQLHARIIGRGVIYDAWEQRIGIRSIAYVQNEDSPEDALPYTIVINGQRIYIRGANVTPLDHLYGNVGAERYEWLVHLAKKANMNMLRIWGGGIIEKPYLYELCDRHGLMIWQEFIQSSSGVDNEPSKKPAFLELISRTAVQALKTRRNHVSLAVWSGGNELMSAPNVPSTYEDKNLAMLKALVAEHDAQRLFLPTSASGPVQYITHEKGVSHDVHGHWKYQGNPGHYELYSDADHLFHSEFGVDGLSSVKSIRKFIGERWREPVSMRDSLVWRHHGEWWDTYDRDLEMFGSIGSLPLFADMSQWIQGEGLRFILEANRRRAFRNSGSLIWQLNEPWPNVSCTNLVDYYNETKMAYYWARQSFAPNHAWISYRKLHYATGERLALPVYSATDGISVPVTVHAEVLNTAGTLLHSGTWSGNSRPDAVVCLGELDCPVPSTDDGLFYVRLRMGLSDRSVDLLAPYIFSTHEGALYEPALSLSRASIAMTDLETWRLVSAEVGEGASVLERSYLIENKGTTAALHIYPQEKTDLYWITASDAYFTLFPGESRIVRMTCRRKAGELFLTEDGEQSAQGEILPEIKIYAFGSNDD